MVLVIKIYKILPPTGFGASWITGAPLFNDSIVVVHSLIVWQTFCGSTWLTINAITTASYSSTNDLHSARIVTGIILQTFCNNFEISAYNKASIYESINEILLAIIYSSWILCNVFLNSWQDEFTNNALWALLNTILNRNEKLSI